MNGLKYDTEKTQWHLMNWEIMDEVAQVLTHGAIKYSPENWREVPDGRNRYFSALQRHFIAWWNGERDDPDSGYHHLAHVICNAMFLRGLEKEEDVKRDYPSLFYGIDAEAQE